MPIRAYSYQEVPTMEYGTVVARDMKTWAVRSTNGHYSARRAKSCLLAPEVGDSVLLCTNDLGHCYILTVLDGAEDSGTLEMNGDLDLQVNNGSLHLSADNELSMGAAAIRITADRGSATLKHFSCLVDTITGQFRTLSLAAENCLNSFHSLTQRLGAFFRSTEGHEEIQAGSTRVLVEDTHVLHCKNSVLMAEEDARIDADQIQLG